MFNKIQISYAILTRTGTKCITKTMSSNREMSIPTPIPSGKQRQKKSGRGRPTASLIASVKTAVISTENKMPANISTNLEFRYIPVLQKSPTLIKFNTQKADVPSTA